MAHEGESTDHLEDLSGGGGGSRSTRVLATIVTWTISAFKTRGINNSTWASTSSHRPVHQAGPKCTQARIVNGACPALLRRSTGCRDSVVRC